MNKMDVGISRIRHISHYFAALFLLSLVGAALFLTSDNRGVLQVRESLKERRPKPSPAAAEKEERETRREEQTGINDTTAAASSCDLFAGRWVYDAVSQATYEDGKCSFMMGDYACEKYGRKDLKYRNWRWQPHHCDLPRLSEFD